MQTPMVQAPSNAPETLTGGGVDVKLSSTTPTTPLPSDMRTPVGYSIGGRP
jgi:hypothetical protein